MNRLMFAACVELVVMKIVWPSGSERTACIAAMLPSPPGLLSTITVWLVDLASS